MIGSPTRLNQNPAPAARATAPYPGTVDGFASKIPAPRQPQGAAPFGDGAGVDGGADGDGKVATPARREATPSGDVCRLLSLLADRTRLKILRILAGGERPVVALTAELRLPQPTVSHHLAWLRMMDLVSPRRQGKHVFYALGAAAQCDDAGVLTLTADDATVTITPYTGG